MITHWAVIVLLQMVSITHWAVIVPIPQMVSITHWAVIVLLPQMVSELLKLKHIS